MGENSEYDTKVIELLKKKAKEIPNKSWKVIDIPARISLNEFVHEGVLVAKDGIATYTPWKQALEYEEEIIYK